VKIKKTMSAKAIKANQANGQKSTGPINVGAVAQNARTHGLASKRLVFRDQQSEREFDVRLAALMDEYQPVGPTAWEMVHELAFCFWRKTELNAWELQELDHRREAPAAILKTLAENHEVGQLPLFTQQDGLQSAAGLGWDCEELVVRTGTSNSEQAEAGTLRDRKDTTGHVQIEAKLNKSLDSILRYQAAAKRDLHDTIKRLEYLQPEAEKSGKGVGPRESKESSRRIRRTTRGTES
jgi:hypothetical protein